MSDQQSVQLFENSAIRTAWDEARQEWYFSVVDVVGVLTEQTSARSASTYWAVLKKRLKEEGANEGAVALKEKAQQPQPKKKASKVSSDNARFLLHD